jgi:hypothetical protein
MDYISFEEVRMHQDFGSIQEETPEWVEFTWDYDNSCPEIMFDVDNIELIETFHWGEMAVLRLYHQKES